MRQAITLLVTLLVVPSVGAADPDWVMPMKEIHKGFTGKKGTLALFGDSITVSMAFWAPWEYAPKTIDKETAEALATVQGHMNADCWRKWRGPEYGNESGKTTQWADENTEKWLKKLNPEVVVLMLGTNDLNGSDAKTYEAKTRSVVRKCLKNGTIVILTTIPPRSGLVEKSKSFADVQRSIAVEFDLPMIDYQAEILKRRPNDWDGTLPKFKDFAKDVYEVPTLIAADGVHPSNPSKFSDYSDDSLKNNGFQLRNHLTLHTYADVIRRVLQSK